MLAFFSFAVAIGAIFSVYWHFFAEKTPENKSDNELYDEGYYFQQSQENDKQKKEYKSDFSESDDEEDDFLDNDYFDEDDDK